LRMARDQLVARLAPSPPRRGRVLLDTHLAVEIEDPPLPVEEVEPLGGHEASRARWAHPGEGTHEKAAYRW
jgi:hypothetical protein